MDKEVLNPQSDGYDRTYRKRFLTLLSQLGLSYTESTVQWGIFTADKYPNCPLRSIITSIMIDTDESIRIEVSARHFASKEIDFLRYSKITGWQMYFKMSKDVLNGNFRF